MNKHRKDDVWLHDFYVRSNNRPEELSLDDPRDVRKICLFVEETAKVLIRGQDAKEELVSLTFLELGSKYRKNKNVTITLPYIRTIMGGFKGKVIYNQQSCHLSDARSLSSVTLQAAKKVRAVERAYEYKHGRPMGLREREALVEKVRDSFKGKVKPRIVFADRLPLAGFEGEAGDMVHSASGIASMVKGNGLVGKIGLQLVGDSVRVGAVVSWLLDGRVEALAGEAQAFLDDDTVGVDQLPHVGELVSLFYPDSVRIVDVCEIFRDAGRAKILLDDIGKVKMEGSVQEMLF